MHVYILCSSSWYLHRNNIRVVMNSDIIIIFFYFRFKLKLFTTRSPRSTRDLLLRLMSFKTLIILSFAYAQRIFQCRYYFILFFFCPVIIINAILSFCYKTTSSENKIDWTSHDFAVGIFHAYHVFYSII